MPPAYKSMDGPTGTGYAAYDLYDLGEFDQKGSVRTKYGTRDEFLAAVTPCRRRAWTRTPTSSSTTAWAGTRPRRLRSRRVDCDNRNCVHQRPYKIKAWSHYKFPGRGERYSTFKWHWQHFNAFGVNADAPDEHGKIYRVVGKTFSGEVCFEFGNFDYLMGADVDMYHPEVQRGPVPLGRVVRGDDRRRRLPARRGQAHPGQLLQGLVRAPAVAVRGQRALRRRRVLERRRRGTPDVPERTEGAMRLFDVPLHFKFHEAAEARARLRPSADLRQHARAARTRSMAVTFVDNHDSQPGQSLESWVDGLVQAARLRADPATRARLPLRVLRRLLRQPGRREAKHKLTSHRKLIDHLLQARAKFTYGEQHDYFDHPTCVGWLWTGDAEHSGALAVVMSTATPARSG